MRKVTEPSAYGCLLYDLVQFARINGAVRMSPAMACGLEQRLWDIGDIVKLTEEWAYENENASS